MLDLYPLARDKFIPQSVRSSLICRYIDFLHFSSNFAQKPDEEKLIPPQTLNFVGGGDFKNIGNEFFNHCLKYGNVQPDDRVLEVGCGIGRIALPFTKYLSKKGGYWGMDIVKEGIYFCQKMYSNKYPNFNFKVADVYNKAYYPEGRFQPHEYPFPYEDSFFDFIFLTSVFTHMYLKDVDHYLSEISRILKPGKKCLITYFILNSETDHNIQAKKSTLDFKYPIEGGWTTEEFVPEAAIACEETIIRQMYQKYNLKIDEPILYGAWSGREQFVSFQDIIVATKNNG